MDFLAGLNISTQQRLPRPPSPPSEVWDNDEDFDWTSLSGNALELPRSEIGSEDNDKGDEDDEANDNDNDDDIVKNGSWDDNFAAEEEDEDKVDTLKVSQLASETLAQLALLKKQPSSGPKDIGDADIRADLPGNVTNLGTFTLKPIAVDMEAGGDWDEDLEVPDTFPSLRLSQQPSSFASDLEFETPSLGSTSDATTSASANSEVRSKRINARQARSSTSSISSAFTSPSKSRVERNTRLEEGKSEQEEEDSDLPGHLSTLHLGPSVGRVRSNASLDQQRLLWDEGDRGLASPPYKADGGSSLSEASAKESDADEGFEGLELPDQIFAKSKAEAPSIASTLQAKLDTRKRAAPEAARRDGSVTGRDVDFSQGLVITEDLDLSVNRLNTKRFNNHTREPAHQKRESREVRKMSSARIQATQPDDLAKSRGEVASRQTVPFATAPSKKSEAGASLQASSSRLLASTKASRARETVPRSESPLPSASLESVQWSRPSVTSIKDSFSSSQASRPPRQNQSQDGFDRATTQDRPLTPSITLSSRSGSARYSMPTAASRARQVDISRAGTTSPLESPAVTRLMRGPKRPRAYGDGRELEGFDDLPVYHEREIAQSGVTTGTSTKSDSNKTATVSQVKSGPKPTSARLAADLLSSTKAAMSSKEMIAPLPRTRQFKRKQPTLIRNLGGPSSAPRVEGSNMKWNPVLRRWEGNEEEGRTFEREVRGTGRPALITRLAVGWQQATSISSKSISSPPPAEARVVGDMIFDPVRLCWLNKNKEDEIDPFADMDDDSDDDQQTSSRLKGKQAGDLKMKSSSASIRHESPQWSVSAINRVLRGSKKEGVPSSLADRIPPALWTDCVSAKIRHDEEMTPFLPTKQMSGLRQSKSKPSPARDRSSYLYLIQTLARKASSS
jgi:hypothetical protein